MAECTQTRLRPLNGGIKIVRTYPLHRSLSLSIDPSDAPSVDCLARDLVDPGQVCFGCGVWGTHRRAIKVDGKHARARSYHEGVEQAPNPFATQVQRAK